MTCDACTRAKVNCLTGRFNNGCKECTARMLAHGPAFQESATADAMTPNYRSALQSEYGADWMQAHAKVKEWAERIAAAKKITTKR